MPNKKMQDGRLILTSGRSRSGKTLVTIRDTRAANRLIVWDPKGTWGQDCKCEPVSTASDLVKRIRAAGAGPARLALCNWKPAEFQLWAQAAFAWGRIGAAARVPTVVVAEEIGGMTAPGRASDQWHRLLSQGLEFGITIHALTQRPAESDKTTVGNASLFRVFAASRAADAAYMAREINVAADDLQSLPDLSYYEYNARNGGDAVLKRLSKP